MMSTLRAVRTDAALQSAWARIGPLMHAVYDSAEGAELDLVTDLGEQCKAPRGPVDPASMLPAAEAM